MDAIDNLLNRGVDKIYPSREALEKVLRSGKKLRLYQGFDPTGDRLHIGHAVGFRKLRQWQDLGHHVIFLVGDGTGLAGDPSGRLKARGRFMTRQELRDNARDYLMQAGKIVNFAGNNPIEILYNGDWLTKLKLEDILGLAQHFSVQQMIERDMYQARFKAGNPINLREFLYPLLQGYDSVQMNVDLEQGGTDQTFNMLAGRTLVRAMQGREKFVMTVPLLTDAQGNKIGKSEGNVIGLTDPPMDFYGKIMALSDEAIIPCFTFLTDIKVSEIEKIKKHSSPIDFKKRLAFELTKQFNSESEALAAQKDFELVHQQQKAPETTATELRAAGNTILEALTKTGLSKSAAKRLLGQNAIERNGKVIAADLSISSGDIIKIGKKKFIKIL